MRGGATTGASERTTVPGGRPGALRAAVLRQPYGAAPDLWRPRGLHPARGTEGGKPSLGAHGGEWNDETEASAQGRLSRPACLEKLKTFNPVKDWT